MFAGGRCRRTAAATIRRPAVLALRPARCVGMLAPLKWRGGSSGNGAMTSTGSGRCSSRVGRAPFMFATRSQAPAPSAQCRLGRHGGRRLHALGQVAVARQQAHHVLRPQPERQPVGEVDGAVLAQRSGERARSPAARPVCRSTPRPRVRPGSSARRRSRDRARPAFPRTVS